MSEKKLHEALAKLKRAHSFDEAIKIVEEYNIHYTHVGEMLPGALGNNFYTLGSYIDEINPVTILNMMKKCDLVIGAKEMTPEELLVNTIGLDRDTAKEYVERVDAVRKAKNEEFKKSIGSVMRPLMSSVVDASERERRHPEEKIVISLSQKDDVSEWMP